MITIRFKRPARMLARLAALLMTSAVAVSGAQSPGAAGTDANETHPDVRSSGEFIEYINGRDLSLWQGPVDSYEVKNGFVVCRPGKGGDLLTRDEFENGIILVEFRLPVAGNNGIALRTPRGGGSAKEGLEIQILDSDGYNARLAAAGKPPLKPYQYHGSLYFCAGARAGFLRPVGEWNTQEIRVAGSRITVTLNGTQILDVDTATLDRSKLDFVPKGLDRSRGHIGLAGHNDPVEFRSFKVQRF